MNSKLDIREWLSPNAQFQANKWPCIHSSMFPWRKPLIITAQLPFLQSKLPQSSGENASVHVPSCFNFQAEACKPYIGYWMLLVRSLVLALYTSYAPWQHICQSFSWFHHTAIACSSYSIHSPFWGSEGLRSKGRGHRQLPMLHVSPVAFLNCYSGWQMYGLPVHCVCVLKFPSPG